MEICVMARYAIPDIHGCAHTFYALLEKIGLSRQDELYLLGDYINKGPRTKTLLDHLIDLEASGYQLHLLTGNHEQGLLDAYFAGDSAVRDRFLKYGGWETLISFSPSATWDWLPEYLPWFEKLHWHLELDDYILVHGGLNFALADPLSDLRALLTLRDWRHTANKTWLAGKRVLHGHNPFPLAEIRNQIADLDNIPVAGLDAGCVYDRPGMHQLCALDMDTLELFTQPNLDS